MIKMDDYEQIYKAVLGDPIFRITNDAEIIEYLVRRCYDVEKENGIAHEKLQKIAKILSPDNWIRLFISEDDLPF